MQRDLKLGWAHGVKRSVALIHESSVTKRLRARTLESEKSGLIFSLITA